MHILTRGSSTKDTIKRRSHGFNGSSKRRSVPFSVRVNRVCGLSRRRSDLSMAFETKRFINSNRCTPLVVSRLDLKIARTNKCDAIVCLPQRWRGRETEGSCVCLNVLIVSTRHCYAPFSCRFSPSTIGTTTPNS